MKARSWAPMKPRGVRDQDRKTKNAGSPPSSSPHMVQITDICVAPSATGAAAATAASYTTILATAAATEEAAVLRERLVMAVNRKR